MKKLLYIFGLSVIVLCSLIIGFLVRGDINGIMLDLNTLEMTKYDMVTTISCGSDSMGLSLHCNNKVYLRIVDKKEKFIEGEIYVYSTPRSENDVIHRLIKILDNDTYIFKGDNNRVADIIVTRDRIKYKVEMVEY